MPTLPRMSGASIAREPLASGARLTLLRPLWSPLGYQHYPWGTRYWLSIGDPPRVVSLRAGQMHGITFLADIYPDLEYWRRLFPRASRKIDTRAALLHFIRACLRAGEYRPG